MIDFASIRAANPIADVVGRYVELRRAGTEYRGLCPFHADKSPSLYVNTKKGKAFCMACHWAGDSIDFVAEYESCDLSEAARKLGHDELPKDRPAPAPLPPDTSDEWQPILPVPADAPAYNPAQTFNPKRGRVVRYRPVRQWPYMGYEGELLGYVLRLEFDGQKITPTITYCEGPNGERRWCTKPFPLQRPLYGLDQLTARPQAPVVVVEGEKAAEAAQRALPRMVVVTWPGGTNGVRWADFSPLELRDVTFWPDADGVGIEAMREIAAKVPMKRRRWISTDGLPKGFDAADVEGDMAVFCKARVTDRAPKVDPPPGEGSEAPEGTDVAAEQGGRAEETASSPMVTASPPKRLRADLENATDPSDNLPAKYSEVNVARSFAGLHENDLRYVSEWGRWMTWDGQRWCRDRDLSVFDLATRMCCAVADHARMDQAEFTNERQRQATIARYGEKRTIYNVTEVAKADRRIAAVPEQWDADNWLLNTPGGVVDLRDGTLHPQKRDAYQTRITAVALGQGCPTWLRFLDEATGGDKDIQAYLQRIAGYSLTGSVREQAFWFIYGPGGNGKGVFINTLRKILGEYAQVAGADMFTERKHDAHPTELAGLQGSRLVVAQETEEGKRWAEARIKSMTGEDPISARFMRQNFFEYMPQFKIIITGNHKPGLRNVDEAIKRRLRLIPFEIKPAVKDPFLQAKLWDEAPGIFRWALEGCLEWQRIGLADPERVMAATTEYLDQQDVLGNWLEECVQIPARGACRRGDLYRSFKAWAEEAGEYVLPQKRFITAMESRGHVARMLKGIAVYDGIGLKAGSDDNGWPS